MAIVGWDGHAKGDMFVIIVLHIGVITEVLTISKEIVETGKISIKDGKVNGIATFKIVVADYNIKIPKIVRQNIAEIVEVTVKLDLKKK